MDRLLKIIVVMLLIIMVMLFSGCSIFGDNNIFVYYTPTPTPNKDDLISKPTPGPKITKNIPPADIPESSINALIEQHIPDTSKQVILVAVDGKTQSLYCIDVMDYGWRVAQGPFKCNIGKKGLGKTKQGDYKSPVGVMELGTAFGYGSVPRNMKWPWRETRDNDYWVEDKNSKYFNKYVNTDEVEKDWKKAIKLKSSVYKRALEIKYNPEDDKELGSSVFLHIWKDSKTKTSGSTTTSTTTIETVLRWLDPDKKPVIMQYDYKNTLPKGFCYIKDFAPQVMYDIKFASENNILGEKSEQYEEAVGISTISVARALNNASKLLKEKGYRLVVYDAYRPQSTSKQLSELIKNEENIGTKKDYYPNTDKKDFAERYFDEKSIYSRGGAVDVGIVDRNDKALDLGTFYQFIDKKSAYTYKDLDEKQLKYRKILHDAMIQAGFYANEQYWWSFYLRDEPFPEEYFDFVIK